VDNCRAHNSDGEKIGIPLPDVAMGQVVFLDDVADGELAGLALYSGRTDKKEWGGWFSNLLPVVIFNRMNLTGGPIENGASLSDEELASMLISYPASVVMMAGLFTDDMINFEYNGNKYAFRYIRHDYFGDDPSYLHSEILRGWYNYDGSHQMPAGTRILAHVELDEDSMVTFGFEGAHYLAIVKDLKLKTGFGEEGRDTEVEIRKCAGVCLDQDDGDMELVTRRVIPEQTTADLEMPGATNYLLIDVGERGPQFSNQGVRITIGEYNTAWAPAPDKEEAPF
jgi:hypothetical protein